MIKHFIWLLLPVFIYGQDVQKQHVSNLDKDFKVSITSALNVAKQNSTIIKDSNASSGDNVATFLSANQLSFSGQWFLSYQMGETNKNNFNQFQLKRGYMTINKSFSSRLSGRITSDISVDREGDGKGDMELRLKYCYIKYSLPGTDIFTKSYIEAGLVHRPWLDFEEHINGYRVQGTMFLERVKVFNSADYGVTFVSLLGGEMNKEYQQKVNKSNPGKFGSIAFGIYNGGGYHATEENENKTLEGRVTIRPFPLQFPGLQLSYQGVYGKGNTSFSPDWTLNTAFLSWEQQNVVFTATYFTGRGNSAGSALNEYGESLHRLGYSLFGEYKMAHQKWSIIGRFDYLDGNKNLDVGHFHRYIAGVAYHVYPGFNILLDVDASKDTKTGKIQDKSMELATELHF